MLTSPSLVEPPPAPIAATPTLTLRTKVGYGLGGMCESIKQFAFGYFLLFYYTSVLGLSGTLVGIAIALGLVWDACVDPWIGFLSDRSSSPYGRRHRFMFTGAAAMGVGFFLVFAPPSGLPAPALFLWLVATNLFVRTAQSVFTVPYLALGAELTAEYHARTSVVAFRAVSAMAGTLGAALVSMLVFSQATAGADGRFHRAGYTTMAAVFAGWIAFAGLGAAVGTLSERRRLASYHRVSAPIGFARGLQLALANRNFVVLALSSALFFFGTVINAVFAIHYLTYYARIATPSAVSVFQLVFYVGALLGVGLWLRAAKTFDKHRLYIAGALATSAVLALGYLALGDGRPLGVGWFTPLLAGGALGGACASALWIVPPSMLADVVDEDELETGRRREGLFFGVASCCQQVAASLAVAASGVLLDRFAGLVPGQQAQSVQTVERLGILFSLLPAAILAGSGFLMFGFTLTRRHVGAVQAAARRAAATQAVRASDARL